MVTADAHQNCLLKRFTAGHPEESIQRTACEHNNLMDSATPCIASHPFSITFDEATGQATVIPRDGATALVKRLTSGKLVFCISLPSTPCVDAAPQGLPLPTQTQAAPISIEAQSQGCHPIIVQSSTVQPVSAPLSAVPSCLTTGAEPLQLLADASNAAYSHSSAAKVQAQNSARHEPPAWTSQEARSASASPAGPSALTSPSVPSVIGYVSPSVTSAAPLMQQSAAPLTQQSAAPLMLQSAAPLMQQSAAPLMQQSAAMHMKAALTVKTSTTSPRGPEALALNQSSRHISDVPMKTTAQGSNGVKDHRASISKKKVAAAQEAALRAIRGLHTDTRLKDSTPSPGHELLRLPPGIPIDSRASESRRASSLGNCSDSGGSQQDQSSPLSHSTTGCNSPGPVIPDGAANGDSSDSPPISPGGLRRPPGLHAEAGGNNAHARVKDMSVEKHFSAFQEEPSPELFSGQEVSRAQSTLQPLSQQGIHSHASTFQRPVPQSLVGGLHHVYEDLSRFVPPPPPPPVLSAPRYVQQAQHGHHPQHAQLDERALQGQQRSGSLPTYSQLSALDYEPGQAGYFRTVSQGATDMHYRGLQAQGVYQSPVSTREIVRFMAQEVARKFIPSEVPNRQQWQPPPPPSQAQHSALPQQGTPTVRAPRSDSFEYGFNLSTEIASMQRQRGFQANSGSVMWAEGRSCIQGYEGGWSSSTAEALAGGAQLGLLPVRQKGSMVMNRAGLPHMPNGASSVAINTMANGSGVLSGADERALPIPHVDWLAGLAGDQQPSFPADSLTNSDLQSSPGTAGSGGVQQTRMPHLTGTHASSDELSSFSLPAMFDFLDEVGNLPC